MQVITKWATNTLYFTLTEKATLTSPVYLFEITNQVDLTSIYFIATDTSSYPNRINKFSVIEGVNDPTNGQIICTNTGQYNYRIFEQSSSTNLNPANTVSMVEDGIIKVEGTAVNYTVHQPPKQESVIYGATQ